MSFEAKKTCGVEGEFSNELVVAKYSIERIWMALARMIIVYELPFRFVEHDGLYTSWGWLSLGFLCLLVSWWQGIVLNFG